ncbi:MAG TPA: pyruvate dehydrogenase complex dihydrolipoamide acetyltransferase [Gemmatimonadetes bacterium]|nr:pyruvate dehydrogenase complex dihydrolipoamide acetyltransferase [Gemmatimonadota bacterium]
MATKVHMEALSPTMEEGQVVKWLKSEGDDVTSGEIIAEIETDKATMELTARGDGVLRAILVSEGGTAPVGEVIALIGATDEDISEFQSDALGPSDGNGEGLGEVSAATADEGVSAVAAETGASAGVLVAGTAPIQGRIKASPLARRLAAESGIELSGVSGSGPAGRIVKRDVEAAVAAGPAPGVDAAPTTGAPASQPADGTAVPISTIPAGPVLVPTGAEYVDAPLSQMRKTIARRLTESIGPVPHFFLTIDVDMGRAIEARRTINTMLEREGRKISLNDLIIRATAAALKRHPACNAHWLGDSIRIFNRVHIGVAVAVEDGLITPIIRDADLKGVAHIGAEVRELAGRAREKKLQPDEYTGATFSISNLGMFGIHEFTAVINPPESGILAVGGVEEVPVVEAGQVVIRNRMKITMSCDHRVIDGALGAAFLATLKGMLEEPTAILV